MRLWLREAWSKLVSGDETFWSSYVRPFSGLIGLVAGLVASVAFAPEHDLMRRVAMVLVAAALLYLVAGPAQSLLARRHRERARRAPTAPNAQTVPQFRRRLRDAATGRSDPVAAFVAQTLDLIEDSWANVDLQLRFNATSELSADMDGRLPQALYPRLTQKLNFEDPDGSFARAIQARSRDIATVLPANTPHALVFDTDFEVKAATVFFPARYSDLCAILQEAHSRDGSSRLSIPRVLGGGCLVVCPAKDELLLLRRAPRKLMYPSRLHVFGGNMEPFGTIGGRSIDRSIVDTAIRETHEEAGIWLTPGDLERVLVIMHKESAEHGIRDHHAEEDDAWKVLMRNLPVHFCGVEITPDLRDAARAHESDEGRPEAIAVRDLAERLRQPEEWLPAAWVTVMLWLWSGVPARGERLLRSRDARTIVEDVLRAPS